MATTFLPSGAIIAGLDAGLDAVAPIRTVRDLPSDFRHRPDWGLFKSILAELYDEVIGRYVRRAATLALIEAIRRDLAAININLCREAGLDRSQLALTTHVVVDPEPPHHTDLRVDASGVLADAFRDDPTPLIRLQPQPFPEAPQEAEEALEWGGWPLGAPEDE